MQFKVCIKSLNQSANVFKVNDKDIRKTIINVAVDVFIANFEHILNNYVAPHPAFTCSKLTIETLEQGVKYGQI